MSPSVKKAYVEFRDKRKLALVSADIKPTNKTIITKRNGLVLRRILK